MTKFDAEYLRLCKKILAEGEYDNNRTGIPSKKIPKYSFEFDLREEFPVLQSKQTFARQAFLEFISIWIKGTNKVSWLQERGVHIWDEWRIDEDGIYRIYEPELPGKEYIYEPEKEVVVYDPMSLPISDVFGRMNEMQPKLDENGNIMTAKSLIEGKTIKAAKYYGKELADTYGTAYGFINNLYQLTRNTEYILKNSISDRRLVNDLMQYEFIRTAVLPPCVYCNEWDLTGDTINLLVHQRSCDVPLGLPFNITQYAAFLCAMAQVTGKKVGTMSWSIKDAHIYVNQIEMIEEQINRWDMYEQMLLWDKADLIKRQLELDKVYKEAKLVLDKDDKRLREMDSELRIIDIVLNPTKPELWLNPNVIDSIFDFDDSRDAKDMKILRYKHMGKLDIPKAQ